MACNSPGEVFNEARTAVEQGNWHGLFICFERKSSGDTRLNSEKNIDFI
jgi:hypothetical protein